MIENKRKRGRPFVFNSYVILLGLAAKSIYRLSYRRAGGFIEMIKKNLKLEKVPDFRTIWWRINEMEKFGIRFRLLSNPNGKFVGILDGTGLKKTGSNEWCSKKYSVHKSWIKTVFLIDDKTGQFVNMITTKEHVHENTVLKKLVDPFIEFLEKLLGDGAFDSEGTFRYLEKNRIVPIIPVRKNSSTKTRGFRKKHVLEQFGLRKGPGKQSVLDMQTSKRCRIINQKKWKETSGYYHRPHVESEIWSFKSKFGEGVFSKKEEMRQKELVMKVNIHNMFTFPTGKFEF
jgi:hypothetical protein